MLSVIADVLKSKLDSLEWMERFGGLVFPAVRPEFLKGADGSQAVGGYKVYPVSCGVNMENCWENGRFRHFEPDASKAAIGFFMDNGGLSLRSYGGHKNGILTMEFSLKFVCWANTARLGNDITGGGCLVSGRLVPYVVAQFFGGHSATGLFDGGIEEGIFRNIEVTDVRELAKTPAMFEPFSFASDGANRNLFIYPYDYFGLALGGTFDIAKDCLPEFGGGWEPEVNCLVPPTSSAWIDPRFVVWLMGRPEFESNEHALTGVDMAGNSSAPILAGEAYRASINHVGAYPGSIIVLT